MDEPVEVTAWGLIEAPKILKHHAFVTGPVTEALPDHLLGLSDVLLDLLWQQGRVQPGVWGSPRYFRLYCEERGGMDVSHLIQQPSPDIRGLKEHMKVRELTALESLRDGSTSLRRAREAVRAAQNARLLDILELVRDRVGQMHLRYMGRHTSYYIDKYEVLRVLDQLIEDIARGQGNIEAALRDSTPPDRRHPGAGD